MGTNGRWLTIYTGRMRDVINTAGYISRRYCSGITRKTWRTWIEGYWTRINKKNVYLYWRETTVQTQVCLSSGCMLSHMPVDSLSILVIGSWELFRGQTSRIIFVSSKINHAFCLHNNHSSPDARSGAYWGSMIPSHDGVQWEWEVRGSLVLIVMSRRIYASVRAVLGKL